MSRNLLSLSAVLLIAACGQQEPRQPAANAVTGAQVPGTPDVPVDDDHVECALDGKAGFVRDCALEQVSTPQGLTLVIREPDGGFRRLLVTRDGRGVVAADGAEKARVIPLARDRIEVVIGPDRYRLPATVKGGG